MEKIAENSNTFYFKWSEHIIYSQMRKHKKVDVDDVQEALQVLKQLKSPDKKLLIMSDISKMRGMTKEARKFSEKDLEFNAMVGATALVTESVVSRVVGNFLLKLSKGLSPLKMFTDKEKAADWLHSFVD